MTAPKSKLSHYCAEVIVGAGSCLLGLMLIGLGYLIGAQQSINSGRAIVVEQPCQRQWVDSGVVALLGEYEADSLVRAGEALRRLGWKQPLFQTLHYDAHNRLLHGIDWKVGPENTWLHAAE